MGWAIWRKDSRKEVASFVMLRDDCTCADHCKEVARKDRKKKVEYSHHFIYVIYTPTGGRFAKSIENSGWRMQWVRC